MTEKRFERIYEDVDVFCRDHNAKEVSQFIEREDYDGIVDLLNEQHEQIEDLKDANVRCCNKYSYFHKRMMQVEKENEQLKQFKEKVFTLIEEELEEHPYLTLTEKWNPNCKNYHSCRSNHEKNVFYASRHTLLEKLREKLSYD